MLFRLDSVDGGVARMHLVDGQGLAVWGKLKLEYVSGMFGKLELGHVFEVDIWDPEVARRAGLQDMQCRVTPSDCSSGADYSSGYEAGLVDGAAKARAMPSKPEPGEVETRMKDLVESHEKIDSPVITKARQMGMSRNLLEQAKGMAKEAVSVQLPESQPLTQDQADRLIAEADGLASEISEAGAPDGFGYDPKSEAVPMTNTVEHYKATDREDG